MCDYKILLKQTVWVKNTLTSLQTILAAEEHVAEGRFLLEQQKLNKEESLM
jgi:hypothetical protein